MSGVPSSVIAAFELNGWFYELLWRNTLLHREKQTNTCAGRERFQPFMYERSGGSLAVSLTVHLVWTCGRAMVRASVGAGEVSELPFLVLGAA